MQRSIAMQGKEESTWSGVGGTGKPAAAASDGGPPSPPGAEGGCMSPTLLPRPAATASSPVGFRTLRGLPRLRFPVDCPVIPPVSCAGPPWLPWSFGCRGARSMSGGAACVTTNLMLEPPPPPGCTWQHACALVNFETLPSFSTQN
jgi:hypothetical protein